MTRHGPKRQRTRHESLPGNSDEETDTNNPTTSNEHLSTKPDTSSSFSMLYGFVLGTISLTLILTKTMMQLRDLRMTRVSHRVSSKRFLTSSRRSSSSMPSIRDASMTGQFHSYFTALYSLAPNLWMGWKPSDIILQPGFITTVPQSWVLPKSTSSNQTPERQSSVNRLDG